MALYGRDCDVDSAVRPNIKPVFDGDILMTNELLVRRDLLSYSVVSNSFFTQETALDYTLHHLSPLSRALKANPSSVPHPIIMTERLASPLYSRSITSELLFEAYGVPSVTYGVDSLFAFEHVQARRKGLLGARRQGRGESAARGESGLVVNMGHMSTTLIPVLNGQSLMNRAKR